MKGIKNNSIHILVEIFLERKKRNSKYSLRAFSRDIGMSASNLIAVMKGRKKLSTKQACKIAINLKFTNDKFVAFVIPTLS